MAMLLQIYIVFVKQALVFVKQALVIPATPFYVDVAYNILQIQAHPDIQGSHIHQFISPWISHSSACTPLCTSLRRQGEQGLAFTHIHNFRYLWMGRFPEQNPWRKGGKPVDLSEHTHARAHTHRVNSSHFLMKEKLW